MTPSRNTFMPPPRRFEESQTMIRTPARTLNIAADPVQPPLSREQKAFNALISQIETRRNRLAAWEAAISTYQQKYASRLFPLLEEAAQLRTRMVHCLDRASDQLGKAERRTLSNEIADLAGDLLARHGDEDLRAIYHRHRPATHEFEIADGPRERGATTEPALEPVADPESPEAILERIEAQLEAERQTREDRRAIRKESAKKSAREAKQRAQEQQASQSVREVYRKLASALHPDRESDPAERLRKTALMQRVNQAYDRKNLLQLLELQLESEHIDQAAINRFGPERLQHYNKVLQEQLGELEQEIRQLEERFRAGFGIAPSVKLSPDTLLRQLSGDIAGLQQFIRELKRNLVAFEDLDNVRAWLREIR